MPLDGPIFGEGIYKPREAARLIGTTPQEILRWTRGSGPNAPIWTGHYQFVDESTEISFIDLVELRVVRALRSNGVSLQAIRYAIEYAKAKLAIDRPLSTLSFKTDGPEILVDATENDGHLISLSKKRPGQKVFRKIIDQSLSGLEYKNQRPERWRPTIVEHVVLDPNRSFGTPVIDNIGISTQTIFTEWQRSKSIKYISRLYEVDERFVRDAIKFEKTLDRKESVTGGQGSV
ncbi:MAG: MerR family transcriptional regulator [Rhodobacteraceae bacterium]|nr:MerR family transcriptional regulator [Paracoccaceae bacterium]